MVIRVICTWIWPRRWEYNTNMIRLKYDKDSSALIDCSITNVDKDDDSNVLLERSFSYVFNMTDLSRNRSWTILKCSFIIVRCALTGSRWGLRRSGWPRSCAPSRSHTRPTSPPWWPSLTLPPSYQPTPKVLFIQCTQVIKGAIGT